MYSYTWDIETGGFLLNSTHYNSVRSHVLYIARNLIYWDLISTGSMTKMILPH